MFFLFVVLSLRFFVCCCVMEYRLTDCMTTYLLRAITKQRLTKTSPFFHEFDRLQLPAPHLIDHSRETEYFAVVPSRFLAIS